MAHYFLASIRIRDDREYQKYIEKAGEVFSRYNGIYLAVDNDPVVLEGIWDYSRAVLIRFNTREDFENWYRSDDYQEILRHRLQAAECDTILIEGK
jgi:uncharacterized protein (DUF1330 family)